MAKVRIYEIARDLNMTNRELIDHLKDMDVDVKSHMSSLDDDIVASLRSNLYGKKSEEAIVETRVKPTVIRRRRKIVTTEAPPEVEEAPATAEEAPSETAPVETAREGEQPEIGLPPETETAAEPVDGVEAVSESAKEAKSEEKAAAEPLEKPNKEAKEVKPSKKETAAKIIKLPVKPKEAPKAPAEIAPEDKPPVVEPAAKKPGAPEPDAGAKDKKKKRKKRVEEDVDNKFFKKKISFRKKEVVEGDALYERGARPRKGKKAAKGKASMATQKPQITTAKAIKRRIKIDDTIVLADLAKRMGIKAGDMIKALMSLGVMATVNQTIDFDTAVLVAGEFNYEVERASFEEDSILKIVEDDPTQLSIRPPVVTIMGHVDHGKTSLLDVIRKTHITDLEAGGITQHIGAYSVRTEKGRIAFLDTPGHEAFTAMRARGAQVTDIVVLVVAADDGLMPQTVEAINHAKAASVPIIVAVNKIDKANADIDRVYRQLAEAGLTPEEWGGDTIFVKVSAKQSLGIDDLLEMILLQAEVLELKANADKLARGHVVESQIDPGRGAVATVLIQEGTLKVGSPVVCGVHYGKIRAMLNDRGQQVESAGPSVPVEVVGLSGVPMAGDEFVALADEKDAKQVSQHRIQKQRARELAQTNRLSLEHLYEKMQEGQIKDLNLIIKADVQGSIEALTDSLTKLSNEEVKINVIHSATGAISESDVSLAAVSEAIIIGFNVRSGAKVQTAANEEHVDIRYYNIIYEAIKDIKDAIAGMMASKFEEHLLGRADVREVFQVPKVGAVAGCYVTEGKIERGKPLRLIRDGVVLFEGKNSSLRRYKDDVKEVPHGMECGIGIENYNDIKIGDVIESYYLEEIKPKI